MILRIAIPGQKTVMDLGIVIVNWNTRPPQEVPWTVKVSQGISHTEWSWWITPRLMAARPGARALDVGWVIMNQRRVFLRENRVTFADSRAAGNVDDDAPRYARCSSDLNSSESLCNMIMFMDARPEISM
jgi:hypothetical protein